MRYVEITAGFNIPDCIKKYTVFARYKLHGKKDWCYVVKTPKGWMAGGISTIVSYRDEPTDHKVKPYFLPDQVVFYDEKGLKSPKAALNRILKVNRDVKVEYFD